MSIFERFDEQNEETFCCITDNEFSNLLEKMKCPSNQTEIWTKGLDNTLSGIQDEINDKYKTDIEDFINKKGKGTNKKNKKDPKLVDCDCTIRMKGFQIGEGGPYRKDDKEFNHDKEVINRLE